MAKKNIRLVRTVKKTKLFAVVGIGFTLPHREKKKTKKKGRAKALIALLADAVGGTGEGAISKGSKKEWSYLLE